MEIEKNPLAKYSGILIWALEIIAILLVLLIQTLSLTPLYLLYTYYLEDWGSQFIWVLMVPLGYLIYLFCFVIIKSIIKRFVIGKISIGEFNQHDIEIFKWFLNVLITSDHEIFFFSNVRFFRSLRILAYRLQGAKIHQKSLFPNDLHCYEPELLSIGNKSVVGMGAYLTCHYYGGQSKKLKIAPITIGDFCLVGAEAHLQPGVILKDHVTVGTGAILGLDVKVSEDSIVLNRSYVKDNIVIPPREIWGGVPARKIKNLENYKK